MEAEGYEPIEVSGSEILSGEISRQKIKLRPISDGNYEDVVIPDHTLFGNYPEKIPEEEVKPVNESGEIVLSRVVIPEYVVVHDGSPADSTADNYYVRYRDYIKNVACSEIYATWPPETIKANVLAIMSFTLNRFIRSGTETNSTTLPLHPPLPSITNGYTVAIFSTVYQHSG